MADYEIKLLETVIVLVLYFVLKTLISRSLDKVSKKYDYHKTRLKIIKKLTNILLFLICLGLVLPVWGVDQSQLFYFISSLLTILGIAFFAQWSLISNITSAFIIFFIHPVRIGDSITIVDKEFDVTGKIKDIGVFFLTIKTADNHNITIPNNLFMQKMVKTRG